VQTNSKIQISQIETNRIRSVPHFRNSIYGDLRIGATLEFFTRRYVKPLANYFDIADSMVVDCACGYGWFGIAYLLAGGKKVIAVDTDTQRLLAAKEIARILTVGNRMAFINSEIQNIPLGPNEVDIFVSIETLEHIGRDNISAALRRIKEVAAKGVIITTPNKLFPVIAHDTSLPFIHWLPVKRRRLYARLFGRDRLDKGNEFLTPMDLNILREKFKPASSCLTFGSFEEYRNHFPCYQPYGSDDGQRFQTGPSSLKALYYNIASRMLGAYSFWVMPSLSRVFVRR
jgi:Methyltransferase domain